MCYDRVEGNIENTYAKTGGNLMRIEHIQYPFIFTDDGQRIHAKQVVGNIFKGATLTEKEENAYEVVGIEADENCVNGVCPVR